MIARVAKHRAQTVPPALALLLALAMAGRLAAADPSWVHAADYPAVELDPRADVLAASYVRQSSAAAEGVRPGLMERIAGIARGRTQLEAGYAFVHDEADGVRMSQHAVPDLLLRFGLTDRLEIRVGWPGYVGTRYENALGEEWSDDRTLDPNVGVMLDLWCQRGILPQTAVLAAVPITLQGNPFAMEGLQPLSQVLYRWDITHRLAVGGTTGIALFEVSGDSFTQLQQTVNLDFVLTDRMGLFTEWEMLADQGSAADTTQHMLGGGVSWLLTNRLQLTWRAGAGLNDPAPDFLTDARLAFRF